MRELVVGGGWRILTGTGEMVAGMVTVKAIHVYTSHTAIVRRQSCCCDEFFVHSQPAQTDGQGPATICLSPAFKVQFRLPGKATPHHNQPYLCLFCPAFACALIDWESVGQFSVDVLREFPEQLSSLPACPSKIRQISMLSYQYARATRDTMLPLPDKTGDPCSRPSSARSLRSPER